MQGYERIWLQGQGRGPEKMRLQGSEEIRLHGPEGLRFEGSRRTRLMMRE